MSPIRPEMRARYPKDWALRSRFVRIVRGRGRCEWCGAAHGQPLCQKCHNSHDAASRRAGIRARRHADQGKLFDAAVPA